MPDTKPTKKQIEALEAEIKRYEAKPVGTHERRLKLDMSFEEAVDKIVRAAKPPKKPKK